MSSAAHRFYIILFLIVRLEEGKKNLLSNQSFWPHCTNTLMISDSLFFCFFSCSFSFFFFAHVPEHVRKHYNTVCSGGMLKRSALSPPHPLLPTLSSSHDTSGTSSHSGYIPVTHVALQTTCPASNWPQMSVHAAKCGELALKSDYAGRLYRAETLSI